MRICGLDEAGRGALAGPLVAAAVILNSQFPSYKLRDSKKLSEYQRGSLGELIAKNAERVEVEIISARQINNRGMGWANKEIFRKLIKKVEASKYIVDGNLKLRVRGKSNRIKSLIKADQKIPEVMAASIVAKVTRDRLMGELHQSHPRYGWQTNVGYGTAYHLRAISEYGTVHYHRSVFVTTALRSKMV
jgi:ribonuclease HII